MESSLKSVLVNMLMRGSRVLGPWFLKSIAYSIAAGYFLFRPKRVSASMNLYRTVFPHRDRPFYLYCAWRQFADFTAAYCDRLALETGCEIRTTEEGWEHLEARAKKGLGGIMVVSHMGSMEIAARLFQRKGLRMMIFAGERDPRQVSRQQIEAMASEGLKVQVSSPGGSPSFAGLEALRFLEEGGFVATSGDLSWADRHRRVPVRMFDREVMLPGTAHRLALLTGQPLFSFFSLRTGTARYRFRVSEPRWVKAESRSQRGTAIGESVQAYAKELETVVRENPWQWHIFEPFLEDPP